MPATLLLSRYDTLGTSSTVHAAAAARTQRYGAMVKGSKLPASTTVPSAAPKETAPTTAPISVPQPNATRAMTPIQTTLAQHITPTMQSGPSPPAPRLSAVRHFLHRKDLLVSSTLESPLLGINISSGPAVPHQHLSSIASQFLIKEEKNVEGVFSLHHSSPMATGPLRSRPSYAHDMSL